MSVLRAICIKASVRVLPLTAALLSKPLRVLLEAEQRSPRGFSMRAQHTTASASRERAGLSLAEPHKAPTETPTGSEHCRACEHAGKECDARELLVGSYWLHVKLLKKCTI